MTTQNTNKLKADGSQPVLHQRGHEIQQYGSLVNPPIALSSDARSESYSSQSNSGRHDHSHLQKASLDDAWTRFINYIYCSTNMPVNRLN